jgi:hypothetical protein
MIDDSLRMRSIANVVMLDGVTCDGPDGTPGCGRACALMFKDEWLEPADLAATDSTARAGSNVFVRVRSAAEVLSTLGRDGRLEGMSPSAQMLDLEGQRFRVARMREFIPPDHPLEQRLPKVWYILEGVRCDGRVLGSDGPCDRWCGLLWHESWVEVEGE